MREPASAHDARDSDGSHRGGMRLELVGFGVCLDECPGPHLPEQGQPFAEVLRKVGGNAAVAAGEEEGSAKMRLPENCPLLVRAPF